MGRWGERKRVVRFCCAGQLLVALCAMGTGKIIFLEHLVLQLESSFSDKGFPSIVVWACPPALNLSFWKRVSIGGAYVPRVQESEGPSWVCFPGFGIYYGARGGCRASGRHL